jgi:tRNA 2-selenouridine synthase
MRQALVITAAQALSSIKPSTCLIDVRSPAEFALDHVPGAINLPVLDDQERAIIGTLHATHPFEARRRGASMVAVNIARMLEGPLALLAPDIPMVVYCWRGGNRSGALATILARVGWKTSVVEAGYKALRAELVRDLDRLSQGLQFQVLAGRTGVGKSRILQALERLGAQVLDLEALARHRGSVLGGWPGEVQPSQKQFEALLWNTLRNLDPTRGVFVESESKKVGQRHIPDSLIRVMRASPCCRIEASLEVRSELLLEEYEHFIQDPNQLVRQLDCLTGLHGHAVINQWKLWMQQGEWITLTRDLLAHHYDPSYDKSMQRNYRLIEAAQNFKLESSEPKAIDQLAHALMQSGSTRAEPPSKAP